MFSNLLSVAVMHAGNDIRVTYYTLKAVPSKAPQRPYIAKLNLKDKK